MKMAFLILVLMVTRMTTIAQGTFQNLNFESAQIPSGTSPPGSLGFSAALPGWSGTFNYSSGAGPAGFVAYDTESLQGPLFAIIDAYDVGRHQPLEGTYSAFIFSGTLGNGTPVTATLSQTGLVPYGAVSILMDVAAPQGFTVSLGGQAIGMAPLEAFSSYTLYSSGDISAFAGQTAELSITALAPPFGSLNPYGVLIDDIWFEAIPEPSLFSLFALAGLGAAALLVQRRRK